MNLWKRDKTDKWWYWTTSKLLDDSKSKLDELKSKSTNLIKEKLQMKNKLLTQLLKNFSISIALKLALKNSFKS